MLSPTISLLLGTVTLALCFLYRAAKPHPIPGIPCDEKAASSILGDIPSIFRYVQDRAEFLTWYVERCKVDSPIIQTFVQPFQKPIVVVNDARESLDILTRRTKEFDQSDLFRSVFGALFPNSSASLPTGERWSKSRRLISESMSPPFLNGVARSIVYKRSLELIQLWKEKRRLARGRPFEAHKDVERATYDIIWNVAFGEDIGANREQAEHLSPLESLNLPLSLDDAVHVPELPLPKPFWALNAIVESAMIYLGSPFGRLHHAFASNFYPNLSTAIRTKNTLIREAVDRAWKKFALQSGDQDKTSINSAVEFIVQREIKQAKKEVRQPETHGKYLEGELTMYVGSGFETTAATTCWALKYLTAFPDVQRKLRQSLESAFPKARESDVDPSADEIAEAHLIYLDAFVGEVLRHSTVIPLNSRTTVTEVMILGHRIPKGTTVLLPTRGPRVQTTIQEELRTESSKEFQESAERWRSSNMDEFNPDRWLCKHPKTGEWQYDVHGAPMLAFGGGTRICFGRKLALLEVRTLMALIVWNFDLKELSASMSTFKGIDVVTHKPQKVFLRV